ncbi:MAG: serine O-acetyltransferase EpsC [Candidatus Alcyoniella australis]|nr:serine O-acetyltransferase EpsC [Candidatus Alcyoniella australis]
MDKRKMKTEDCRQPLRDELLHREKLPQIIDGIVASCHELKAIQHINATLMPSRDEVAKIVEQLSAVLFPGYVGRSSLESNNLVFYIGEMINTVFEGLAGQIERAIRHECLRRESEVCLKCFEASRDKTVEFLSRIPQLRAILADDVRAAYEGDPAARSHDEIIFSYPGVRAVSIYRMAHELYLLKVPIIPRIMTEHAHQITGIDIHPGATIGPGLFIDHGTGVVIGETTVIGRNVQIYQGVTLGALRVHKDEDGRVMRGHKRHPDIGEGVTLYAGATILGGETSIGSNSTVGGNLWLTHSVPDGTIAVMEQNRISLRKRKVDGMGRDVEESTMDYSI